MKEICMLFLLSIQCITHIILANLSYNSVGCLSDLFVKIGILFIRKFVLITSRSDYQLLREQEKTSTNQHLHKGIVTKKIVNFVCVSDICITSSNMIRDNAILLGLLG